MSRVKKGIIAHKKRKHLLKYTKGFRGGRRTKYRFAKEAFFKAGAHAYIGRKNKKRVFKRLWNIQINAASRNLGISYSKFWDLLKKNKIALNRKILAEIAQKEPKIFETILKRILNK